MLTVKRLSLADAQHHSRRLPEEGRRGRYSEGHGRRRRRRPSDRVPAMDGAEVLVGRDRDQQGVHVVGGRARDARRQDDRWRGRRGVRPAHAVPGTLHDPGGGVPVVVDGQIVGAVGISSARPTRTTRWPRPASPRSWRRRRARCPRRRHRESTAPGGERLSGGTTSSGAGAHLRTGRFARVVAAGEELRVADVAGMAAERGLDIARMPYVARAILENLVRQVARNEVRAGAARRGARLAQRRGGNGAAARRVAARHARLERDPVLADLAALRDVVAQEGGDPAAARFAVTAIVDAFGAGRRRGRPEALMRTSTAKFERTASATGSQVGAAGVRRHPHRAAGTGIDPPDPGRGGEPADALDPRFDERTAGAELVIGTVLAARRWSERHRRDRRAWAASRRDRARDCSWREAVASAWRSGRGRGLVSRRPTSARAVTEPLAREVRLAVRRRRRRGVTCSAFSSARRSPWRRSTAIDGASVVV